MVWIPFSVDLGYSFPRLCYWQQDAQLCSYVWRHWRDQRLVNSFWKRQTVRGFCQTWCTFCAGWSLNPQECAKIHFKTDKILRRLSPRQHRRCLALRHSCSVHSLWTHCEYDHACVMYILVFLISVCMGAFAESFVGLRSYFACECMFRDLSSKWCLCVYASRFKTCSWCIRNSINQYID